VPQAVFKEEVIKLGASTDDILTAQEACYCGMQPRPHPDPWETPPGSRRVDDRALRLWAG
jgi:hypothetical protein